MPEDTISIIITILNGAKWIDKCMQSICKQTAVQIKQQQKQPDNEKEQHYGPHKANTRAQNPLMSCVMSPIKTHQQTTQTDKSAVIVDDDFNKIINDSYKTIQKPIILTTTNLLNIEICIFNDCSTDDTLELLKIWQTKFENFLNIHMRIVCNESGKPKGVGYGRNMAIAISNGSYLCFQDIDDEMLPNRILKQYILAKRHKDAIIGSKFIRIPPNSTCRFSRWANELSPQNLSLQIYTSNGPTVIMPTWLCHRNVYDKVPGGFCEDGKGTPEDLIFFYKHLDAGGRILRVDECLLRYRYHPEATTFSIAAKTIWRIRMHHLIEKVLSRLASWQNGFTIWNAGKQGRKFFRDLPLREKNKVRAFCDVDKNKICKYYAHFDETLRKITHSIPIIHFTQAQPPLLICMKLDLTKGAFEANLKSLNLTEGKDYILFT